MIEEPFKIILDNRIKHFDDIWLTAYITLAKCLSCRHQASLYLTLEDIDHNDMRETERLRKRERMKRP